MADKICKICGKNFIGYGNAMYCDGCNPYKNRPKRFFIETGKSYGMVDVIRRADSPYCRWVCRCQKCGKEFFANATEIKKSKNGCGKCRKEKENIKKNEELKRYVGEIYGNLKIVDIIGVVKKYGNRGQTFAKCECQICGSVSELPLSRLKHGGALKCAKCNLKHLDDGREIGMSMCVCGTSIFAIDGRRVTNKNSSTGHTGVSYHRQSGKYRAYIVFRRKQYSLGTYARIEDAVAARKAAEKEIYGNFLTWYADNHPKDWWKLTNK